MTDEETISTVGVPGNNATAGVGYIIIPRKVKDIEEYVRHCYNTNTVSINGGHGQPMFFDIDIDEDSIQKIKFPTEKGKYGSAVLWVNIPKHNRAMVIAVFRTKDDLYPLERENWRITKSIDGNLCDFNIKAKEGTIDINIAANDKTNGKLNINLTNDKESCEANVYVKGIVKIHSTKQMSLISDDSIDFSVINEKNESKGRIRYKIGEGFIYEDEFKNKITAKDGEVTIISNKIVTKKDNAQTEPGVLGNKNVDVHDEVKTILQEFATALLAFASATTGATVEPTLGPAATSLNTAIGITQSKIQGLVEKINATKSQTVELT